MNSNEYKIPIFTEWKAIRDHKDNSSPQRAVPEIELIPLPGPLHTDNPLNHRRVVNHMNDIREDLASMDEEELLELLHLTMDLHATALRAFTARLRKE